MSYLNSNLFGKLSSLSSVERNEQILIILYGFIFPLTVVGGNLLMIIIVLYWIYSGNLSKKIKEILSNNLSKLSIAFFLSLLLGILWTDNLNWGFAYLKKMIDFLVFLPILISIGRKEFIRYYVAAYLISIALTVFLSFLVWFGIVETIHKATIINPTPTMSHISYNPFLALAAYIVFHEILFNKNIKKFLLTAYMFFGTIIVINLFITGGRAGQFMFFLLSGILIIQFIGVKKFQSYLTLAALLSCITFSAYYLSDIFRNRANDTINNISLYMTGENQNTSIGLRLAYTKNSLEIFRDNIFFGVGTGDFPKEYRRVHIVNSPELPITVNPHNMYALILVQLGLFGLAVFISIFIYQIRFSLKSSSGFSRNLGFALPISFLFIMLSDSYLLGHFTSALYIYFSSFLYLNIEET